MADWDGLRHSLESGVEPPPFTALRAKRQRRQQRRAIATAFAVVLVGTAGGVAALGQREQHDRVAGGRVGTVNQFVLGDRVPPKGDYTYVVTDVDFVSPVTGWAIGLRCAGEACDVATWRTDDGGRSWGPERAVAKQVPRETFTLQDPAGGGARSLRMVSDTEGFAFNPDLYVTHDGARTWTRVPQPTKVASLGVADDSVWLLERGCAAEDDCDAVLRTGTLGASFAPVTATIPATRGAEAIVRRSDSRHGYLVTWAAPEAPVAALYRTADAGTTWQPAVHPCPDAEAVSMSAGGGRLLVVCTTKSGRAAYASTDAATTWRNLPDPPGAGTLTDVVSVSPTTAYLTTRQPARLLVTNDGGTTWAPARGTALKAYGYGNLDVAGAAHVWAMGDAGVLWRTTDGSSWERMALPPGAPKASGTPRALLPVDKGVTFTGIAFADPQHGWALGQVCVRRTCHAVLRRTADGGRTWQPVNAPARTWADDDPFRVRPRRVAFDTAGNGWLYGRDLFETHDGGAHWRAGGADVGRVVPRGGYVWQVTYVPCDDKPCGTHVRRGPVAATARDESAAPSFTQGSFAAVDEAHAYLLDDGSSGPEHDGRRVATTRDGGATWVTYPAPCPSAATRALAAWAPDRLWAICIGDDGVVAIAQSVDGGAHWHTARADTGFGSVGTTLLPASATDGWLFGADVPLRVTRDGGRTWSVVPLGSPTVIDATFVSPTQGWALGSDGVVYATTDGESWERLGRP